MNTILEDVRRRSEELVKGWLIFSISSIPKLKTNVDEPELFLS